MSENEELTVSDENESAADLTEEATQINAEELIEVIAEFEQYRERLVSETMTAAQKAKLPQKAAMAKIEPELAKIDAGLESLRTQLAAINANN
jgi:methionyl-tRNA formyltransferase